MVDISSCGSSGLGEEEKLCSNDEVATKNHWKLR